MPGDLQFFLNLIQKYIGGLTAAILHELIDKVVVHEKQEAEDGRKIQMVGIHYRFIGYVALTQFLGDMGSVNGNPVSELIHEALVDVKQRNLTASAGKV